MKNIHHKAIEELIDSYSKTIESMNELMLHPKNNHVRKLSVIMRDIAGMEIFVEELKSVASLSDTNESDDIDSIIHSEPQMGYSYWVKVYGDSKYKVGMALHWGEKNMHFRFATGGKVRVDRCADWKRKPVIFNEAYYG